VGQLMLAKNEYESSLLSLTKALDMIHGASEPAKDHAIMEQRTLIGLGRATFALKKYGETVKHVSVLIEGFPTSGLFYEARFLLGRAYKEQGRPADAIEVLREVFTRASDQTLINEATLVLADLQVAEGNAIEALASYQRIVLLGNVDDSANRPVVEKALVAGIRIFADMSRWQDVIESCAQYLAQFPSGENVVEVRNWRAKAMMNVTMGQGAAGTP